MQINPYLNFGSNCEEAFLFYEKVLGGKIIAMIRHKDTPAAAQTAPDRQDKIVHARLQIGTMLLMGSDTPPQFYSKPAGHAVSIIVDTPAEAERIFGALSEGATVQMPMGETFWAVKFGMLVDRYGTPWMVNCEKPMG